MKNIEGLSIYEAEKQIKEYLSPLFVSKPVQPKLKSQTPTEEELKVYKTQIREYEVALDKYKTEDAFYRKEGSRLFDLLEEKIKEDSGLNDIPEQYRNKVYSYAWEQGHSSGFGEVYNYLCSLVNIFN